jgi:hypothetical protein
LTWQHCKKICICEFMIELRLIDYNNADWLKIDVECSFNGDNKIFYEL